MPTNYERYFGTPEKAASVVFEIISTLNCSGICNKCGVSVWCDSFEDLSEWPESEVSNAD